MERPVQGSDAANTAPAFPDQDHDTAGDQSESAMREIAENTKAGEIIGEAIQAQDANGDLLIHTLHGDDASAFSIDRDNGQLKTKEALDYETKDTYMVTVVATDPSGAMASIAVTIMVTDADDDAVLRLNRAPEFDAETATAERSVAENSAAGAAVGDPVVATDGDTGDSLTYSLDAMGDMSFDIDDMGQITVGEGTMLDFESDMTSYTVTVTATDTGRLTATIMVTITVTDENEAPTFDAATADRDVDENTEAAMEIGDPVAAMDVDADDTLTYTLDEMGDMYFDINPATGQLMTEAALDYESGTTSYNVTVTATDEDGLTDTIAVTIAVGDMNEAPVFASAMAMISVDENTPAGDGHR